jgi:hypothetical protein
MTTAYPEPAARISRLPFQVLPRLAEESIKSKVEPAIILKHHSVFFLFLLDRRQLLLLSIQNK